MFTYKVDRLEFSGGQTISVSDRDVVIFVGANNCGKSITLQDVQRLIREPELAPQKSLIDLSTSISGEKEDFRKWIEFYYANPQNDRVELKDRRGQDRSYGPEDIETQFRSKDNLYKAFSKILVHHISTDERLNLSRSENRIALWLTTPKAPIHFLQKDETLLDMISAEVRSAFGKDLIINWGGPDRVWFHVGKEPHRTPDQDRVSSEYLQKLEEIPSLELEGDGIRGFVGCLLQVMIGHHKIILIDEPELFLHPPQAKRLGRLLAQEAAKHNQQIIIATHSADVIQGILSGTDKTAIIRINRDGDKNHAHLLPGEDLRELWSKPLLRSSNAILGLFHEGVVACEADADVRFYESLMIRLDEQGKLERPADFYFVHGGTKGEIATLVNSYKKLHIPTAAIADFDILHTRGEFKKLVETLGGDFKAIQKLYKNVALALGKAGPTRSVKEVVSDIREFLDSIEGHETLAGKDKGRLNALLKDAGDWSKAKEFGVNALKGGEHRECQELLDKMVELWLFVVPSGELESWDRSLPSDKNEWIIKALELIDSDKQSFLEASDFVKHIADYLWNA